MSLAAINLETKAECPLCDAAESLPSWLGRVNYDQREFCYLECRSCRSLYCHPMPDDQTLRRMYGPEYANDVAADCSVQDPKEPQRVVNWLRSKERGTFLDYGCGDGRLLTEAIQLNWRALGVEFDDEVAAATAGRTGADVVGVASIDSLPRECADVLHLGDVIEHLTHLREQMVQILDLLKPGGILLAQGPLEANPNLFTWAVRMSRTLRKSRRTEMAPYHVLLATAEGQRRFFQRFGLVELEYAIHEVAWPAPGCIQRADLLRPKPMTLFLLRRLSQGISRLRPQQWGNRYFYVGRRSVDNESER